MSAPSRVDLRGSRVVDAGWIRARWVYTGSELIEHGAVHLKSGRVIEIRGDPNRSLDPRADFPTGLLHPGFVDAHVHLDLSGLSGSVEPQSDFTAWLEAVRATRLSRTPDELEGAIEEGLHELVSTGTTAVGDFSYEGLSVGILAATGLRSLVLREVLGLERERVAEGIARTESWLREWRDGAGPSLGVAPHAPYSTAGELIRACSQLAGDRPLAIHIAEDPSERQFLADGTGPFRDFLARLRIDRAAYRAPRCSPLQYLERLGVLGANTLLIHANDLTDEDLGTIACHRSSVVFCPRTHRYFSRPAHPLPRLLKASIPVALGTDSSASNFGLSMAEEMREVRRQFPELSSETVFELGTGARLPEAFFGPRQIRLGDEAEFAVHELTREEDRENPLEAFLCSPARCSLVVSRGRILLGESGSG